VQHPDHDYRLEGSLKLRISRETDDDAERFEFAEQFLGELRASAAPASVPARAASGGSARRS
jgi:Ser/Thr protein kinase RdoA (MazF antagonist)